jgi:hypothetical protein
LRMTSRRPSPTKGQGGVGIMGALVCVCDGLQASALFAMGKLLNVYHTRHYCRLYCMQSFNNTALSTQP